VITLYGKYYARTEQEMRESLFRAGGTCTGYYKITRLGVYLYDHQHRPMAFIRRDGFGPVSVTKIRGRYWYSYGLCDPDAAFMGVPDSLLAKNDEARRVAGECFGSARCAQ